MVTYVCNSFSPRSLKKRKYQHKINRRFASKKTYAAMFDLLLGDKCILNKLLFELLELVKKHTSPIRANRSFPRTSFSPAHSLNHKRAVLS